MIKKIILFLFVFISISFGLSAQIFEFATRDAVKLKNRKLIVVLHEEDPEVLNRTKKDPDKTARYKSLVAYANNLLRKTVTTFWKADPLVEFRTYKECIGLSDSSQAYFTLEFTSFRVNENIQLYQLRPDTHNLYPVRRELMNRKEYGYFELKLIEKFKATAFYSFYIPASVPNEYDFITAVQFISLLVQEKLITPKLSTRDYELKIQQNNDKLADRTLIVDSNVVNKQGRSYSYIVNEYDSLSLYELSDPKGIAKIAYGKDSVYAYLAIVPYIDPIARGQSYMGTSGGNISDYEKMVYYMQLIFDVRSGELIYYDKSEDAVIIVRDWRRFQRYSRDNPFTLPNIQRNTDPNQQKQYPQNQY